MRQIHYQAKRHAVTDKHDPLTGKPWPVFIRYAVPSVFGLLSISSVSIINAIFLGNFAGTDALAAVNLTTPATSLLYALAFMMAIGGSVNTARALGAGDTNSASDTFSKTLLVALGISLAIGLPSLFFLDELIGLLGTTEKLHALVYDFLVVAFSAAPLFVMAYVLYYFVIVDGHPVLASISLFASSATSVVLNWLFVVVLNKGVFGAAIATACAQSVILFILLPHVLSTRGQLSLQIPHGDWRAIGRAIVNGFSEFTNEISVGVVTFLFNWIMITRFGSSGVAAFTIVQYMLFLSVMSSYGFADALQPLASKNLGANQPERIRTFLKICLICTSLVGVALSALLLLIPDLLINAFLQEDDLKTREIAAQFAYYFWPVPLFVSANVTLTAFFTALDKPLPSAIIAMSRSLILPAILLLTLPKMYGDAGIFSASPIAELMTLVIAISLYKAISPFKINQKNAH